MSSINMTSFSLRELLVFYYRYRGRLLLAFLLPMLAAILVSYIPSPKYKASSVLTVRLGAEFVYQPEVGSTPNSTQNSIPYDRDQIFKAEVAILSSDNLHTEVIQKLGIDTLFGNVPLADSYDATTEPAPIDKLALEKALVKFNKRFDVKLEKESSVITVYFEHKDPAVAVQVLNTLLDIYMEKRKALYLEPRVALAKEHAENARMKAQQTQNIVESYKRSHNIFALQDERAGLMQQRNDVERQLANINSAALDQKLNDLDTKLDRLNKMESALGLLEHDASVAADEFAGSSHRLSEATAYEDLERAHTGSVRIIQPPSAPAEAKNLQPIIIAVGFVLSVLCMVVVGILTDILTSGFATPEQLERVTGMPVLSAVARRKK